MGAATSLSFFVNKSGNFCSVIGSPSPLPRPLRMPLINLKQTEPVFARLCSGRLSNCERRARPAGSQDGARGRATCAGGADSESRGGTGPGTTVWGRSGHCLSGRGRSTFAERRRSPRLAAGFVLRRRSPEPRGAARGLISGRLEQGDLGVFIFGSSDRKQVKFTPGLSGLGRAQTLWCLFSSLFSHLPSCSFPFPFPFHRRFWSGRR